LSFTPRSYNTLESNFQLAAIAVLGYQVAGIAREKDVIYLFFSAFRHRYRFADVSKMIGNTENDNS
jgi:hypothetical protein